VKKFGRDKPTLGMMHVAYDSDFEGAAPMVSEEDMKESVPHGPDPAKYREQIDKYAKAGFTHVYIHQIGDNQKEFCEWAAQNLMTG